MKAIFEEAKKIIDENEELGDFVGRISDNIISDAEEILGINFPKSYKEFIKNYGAGNFGSEEIYGIINGDFENSGIPDAVWFTIKQRKELKIPNNLIIIYFTGGEEYFCLDTAKMDDEMECPVVSYVIGNEISDNELEIVYSNFSEFLLNIVRREIES